MPDAVPETAVDAVLFDMDGLLLDSESLAIEALLAAGERVGTPMPRAFLHLMIGTPGDHCEALLIERYGADFPMAAFLGHYETELRVMVAAGSLSTKTGVHELLDWLDRHGLKRAVATSSGRARATHHLDVVGLSRRFEIVVTRDDVLRGKPDPALFLLAAQRLGVPPERCLVLEDSHNGVRAAHAAGMRVIMVPDLLEPTGEMREKAHRVLNTLHAVIDFLAEHRPG